MIEEGFTPKTHHSTSLPRFSSCSWSLDVAISSSHMLKLLEPSVTLSIRSDVADDDGKRFQVSISPTFFNLLQHFISGFFVQKYTLLLSVYKVCVFLVKEYWAKKIVGDFYCKPYRVYCYFRLIKQDDKFEVIFGTF